MSYNISQSWNKILTNSFYGAYGLNHYTMNDDFFTYIESDVYSVEDDFPFEAKKIKMRLSDIKSLLGEKATEDDITQAVLKLYPNAIRKKELADFIQLERLINHYSQWIENKSIKRNGKRIKNPKGKLKNRMSILESLQQDKEDLIDTYPEVLI